MLDASIRRELQLLDISPAKMNFSFKWLVLLLATSIPAVAAASETGVFLDLRSAVPQKGIVELEEDRSLALILRSLGTGERTELRIPVETLPATFEQPLAEGSRWHLSIEGDRHWMRETELTVGPGETLELIVWPAGWIRAHVTLDDPKAELPGELEVRFQKGVDVPGLDDFEAVSCPLEEGEVRCKLPAGRLDLRFAIPDFVPIYAWDRALPLGGSVDLEPLRFRRGASLVGWVAAEHGPLTEAELAEVEVTVAPGVIAQAAEERAVERQVAMTRRITPGLRGFFQVSGIDPGLYRVEADHPHYAGTRRGPVLVETDAELELEPLELPPATSLEVRASLPTDPYLEPWRVELHRRGADQVYLEKVAEGTTLENGYWRLPDIDPGDYLVYVYGSRRGLWYQGPVNVLPGDNVLEAEVAFTRLEGLVTLDDEPLPHYRILFYDEGQGRQVGFRGTEEGKFYAFLPKDQVWRVTIEQPGERVHAQINDFEVPPRDPEDRWPKTVIEIPDTHLEGTVIDGSGRPMAGVEVDLNAAGGSAFRATEEDGTFVFRGLRPGRWTVQAIDRENPRESQVEGVEVRESSPVQVPPLVLETSHRITGHLVGSRGEAIGAARVVASPKYEPGQSPNTSDTVVFTDLEGVFEMTVPGRADEYWLTFGPPGYALDHQLVRLPLDSPLIVLAEEAAGNVVVLFDDPPELFRDAKLGSIGGDYAYLKILTQLVGEGPLGDFFGLQSWRQQHGANELDHPFRQTYPRLAPGPYSACFGNGLVGMYSQGRPLPAEIEERHCDSGYLSPGGELELTIPPSAYQAEAERLEAARSKAAAAANGG